MLSRSGITLAVLGVFASVLVPSASHAQFSKLKKAASSAAANAAGVPTTPPRYVDNLDLTSAQLALDGGISSQMLIRDPAGVQVWTGWRRVALGLVAVQRH